MSNDRITQIRKALADAREDDCPFYAAIGRDDVEYLLTELDALRARNEALEKVVEAARELIDAYYDERDEPYTFANLRKALAKLDAKGEGE